MNVHDQREILTIRIDCNLSNMFQMKLVPSTNPIKMLYYTLSICNEYPFSKGNQSVI